MTIVNFPSRTVNMTTMKSRTCPFSMKVGGTMSEVMGIPIEIDHKLSTVSRIKGIWPFRRIVVGPKYFVLGDHEKTAVLLHEVAHCQRWHLEMRFALLPVCWMKAIQRLCREQEFTADRFAAECGYAEELSAVLRRLKQPHGPLYPSNDERIARLENDYGMA